MGEAVKYDHELAHKATKTALVKWTPLTERGLWEGTNPPPSMGRRQALLR